MVPAHRCAMGCIHELKAALRQEGVSKAGRPEREATKGLFCAHHCINGHLYGRRGTQGSQRASGLQGDMDKVVESGFEETSGPRAVCVAVPAREPLEQR